MNIYLIRHAEVDKKYHGCYNGWIDISLSENGHFQAQTQAKNLKEINFDKVYSSDLKRCKETLRHFGFDTISYEKSLREKHWGDSEGLNYTQICKNKNTEFKDFHQWIKVLGGESIETFNTRIEDIFFNKILLSQANNILIMTHAGVIRSVLSKLNGSSLEDGFNTNIPYASCTQLEKIGEKINIIGISEV